MQLSAAYSYSDHAIHSAGYWKTELCSQEELFQYFNALTLSLRRH
jgi:hypothetical protein